MKTINSININNAKNEVCNAFMQLMVPHVMADETIQKEFKPQAEELQRQAKTFADCLENHHFSLLTEKVTAADTRRDKKWTAAKAVLVAEIESPDPAHKAAAETINRLFDSFGKIRNMGYAEQSGAMSSLCSDLVNNHLAELQLTNLLPLIQDLQAANKDFIKAYDERTEMMGEYKKNETRDAKLALITAYRTLIFLVNARILQKGTDGLENFIAYANALIRQYRIMIGQKPAPSDDATLEDGLEDEELDGDMGGGGDNGEGDLKPEPEPENPGQDEPENPGQDEPEKPGQGEPENPGQDEPEKPGQGEPENPGQDEPEKPGQGDETGDSGEDSDTVTITYRFVDGRTETRQYPKGTIIRPTSGDYPANTPGYTWNALFHFSLDRDRTIDEIPQSSAGDGV